MVREQIKPNIILRPQHAPTPAEQTARTWLADGAPVRVAVSDEGLVIATEYGQVFVGGRLVWRVEA